MNGKEVIVSCGLDRCLRVHRADNGTLLQRQYLKQRLNNVSVIDVGAPSFEPGAHIEKPGGGSGPSDFSESSDDYSSDDEEGMWRRLDKNERKSFKRRKR